MTIISEVEHYFSVTISPDVCGVLSTLFIDSRAVTCVAVYESESTVTLVMEYASGGELFDHINSQSPLDDSDHSGDPPPVGLNESEARQLFRQLVSAVQYLHEVNL